MRTATPSWYALGMVIGFSLLPSAPRTAVVPPRQFLPSPTRGAIDPNALVYRSQLSVALQAPRSGVAPLVAAAAARRGAFATQATQTSIPLVAPLVAAAQSGAALPPGGGDSVSAQAAGGGGALSSAVSAPIAAGDGGVVRTLAVDQGAGLPPALSLTQDHPSVTDPGQVTPAAVPPPPTFSAGAPVGAATSSGGMSTTTIALIAGGAVVLLGGAALLLKKKKKR